MGQDSLSNQLELKFGGGGGLLGVKSQDSIERFLQGAQIANIFTHKVTQTIAGYDTTVP